MSPAVWVSRLARHMPVATATAEPALEPPGVRVGSQGLRVGAGSFNASSVQAVLPTTTAPAWRSRATAGASPPLSPAGPSLEVAASRSDSSADPALVGRPAVANT